MRIKTRELTGRALDWSVAYAIGVPLDFGLTDDERFSTDWAQAGPLIEREKIELVPSICGTLWYAESLDRKARVERCPTPLVAAMRCYISSRLGDEVEVPDELV